MTKFVRIPVYSYDHTSNFADYVENLTFEPRDASSHMGHDQMTGREIAIDASSSSTELAGYIVAPAGSYYSSDEELLVIDNNRGLYVWEAIAMAKDGCDDMAWEDAPGE